LLADGLALYWVALRGQVLPGLSLVVAPNDLEGEPLAPRAQGLAGLPVITFPGNLGDADTLVDAWRLMERG
jgi:uncharacterized protein YgbK (DUF1537 family)